ncbi:MAG: hypothetical protein K1X72_20145 [Pyrinomonadaceae bacterium]|nr:hypothetical protein [Pyrinomonadaceae bacterium]
MHKLNFTIKIAASKEKVWETLWNETTYPQWTNVFCEGSYAVSDWKEGSKVHFLTPNGQGMYSLIAKMVENEFISFNHLGLLKDKIEQPPTEETKQWSESFEDYTLTESEGVTTLSVNVDSLDQYVEFFNEKFPVALQNVKNLAETKVSAAI